MKLCDLCGKQEVAVPVDSMDGIKIYVCPDCLDLAVDNFVWHCNRCKQTWYKSKEEALELDDFLEDEKDRQIIMAIDSCVNCSPNEFMHTGGMSQWH